MFSKKSFSTVLVIRSGPLSKIFYSQLIIIIAFFTTKEFDLLTFLAENPNHVFTKEELFREIWDMESIGDIATVTVHIKKIREKVEYDTAKPQYIETIWGVGYRFKV